MLINVSGVELYLGLPPLPLKYIIYYTAQSAVWFDCQLRPCRSVTAVNLPYCISEAAKGLTFNTNEHTCTCQ